MMDGGMMDGGMMGGGMVVVAVLWVVVVLVLLALMIAALIWLIRSLRDGSHTGGEARRELDRRYAAGEIDRDDYLARRRDLEERRPKA